jgi:preprotein translocase subunit SecF
LLLKFKKRNAILNSISFSTFGNKMKSLIILLIVSVIGIMFYIFKSKNKAFEFIWEWRFFVAVFLTLLLDLFF